MKTILTIDSISVLHERLGYPKPKHPLITVVDLTKIAPGQTEQNADQAVILGFYAIVCKRFKGLLTYGKNYYDFDEGTLLFTAPHQVMSVNADLHIEEGWALYFHPDLLHGTELGRKIYQYSFFQYDTREALHISEAEDAILKECVEQVKREYSQSIDKHTQSVIVSQIDLLLQYCSRFYDRQFLTRSKQHSDLLQHFESLLRACFEDQNRTESGLPSVGYFAQQLNVSASYLTDTLHKLTGKTTQELIHLEVIERAKSMLWGSEKLVSEIAYALGFEHPSHFSKLFKSRTGKAPSEFRHLN
jgi:AraC-like DNA-binding protein